ncbi:uncharacterized protein I303_104746 [Kwoniella dejecticola CBS 10117]|uniref:Gfd2/YDR514C-like C-terminal domain-containing protein n=1 Tax=Kwoniella dejecticola CBS 10117 TaxID=1296121 RepID=A0A1A6A4G6_9TREE|nr:uncharacterized protein I303_04274 [Kwoniella dejecticola CBS 10117]OBR84949.1 hypothetical protein I303_04274 [Kwoniella dejecticola CBS 10117]
MADATKYGNAIDFDVDLHSIYAAYLGLFESSNTDWWDKSWGGYFTTFNDFLGFGWEVMVVVDSSTGKPHIAVRREQIALFAKMIRTRFGESLPKDPPTTLPLEPVPTRNLSLRRLITVRDLTQYRKLAQTLPAAELSYLRTRVKAGEVEVAEQLFYAGGSSGEREVGGVGVRDNGVGYTFACVKTTWWEKGGAPHGLLPGVGRTQGSKNGQNGKGLVLEIGVATLRCANLRAVNVWPPIPDENYRKSHYIVEEWVDKRANVNPPNFPRNYAFGNSRFVAQKDVEKILDANVGALASQEADSNANTLILLTLGDAPPLPLPASSTLPSNILHLDVLALELNLLRRAQKQGITGLPDRNVPLNSLGALLQTLQIPIIPFAPLGNAGNDAYYTLLAFQKLMMRDTRLPERLFQQPEPYMNGMPYPSYSPFPTSGSMNFSQYSPLPMPVMPAAGKSRRDSSSSPRRSDFAPPSFPSSPSSTYARRASDTSRPRPASMGDSLTAAGITRPRTPENQRSQAGSAPNTGRAQRKSMARSQTVFWDESAYAQSPPADQLADSRERNGSKVSIRPNMTGTSSGSEGPGLRGRSMNGSSAQLPPSALRSGMTPSGSSRSISWEGGTGASGANTGTGSRASSVHGLPFTSSSSKQNMSSLRASGSSTMNLARQQQHQQQPERGGSEGTSSSTKLSTDSSGENKLRATQSHNNVNGISGSTKGSRSPEDEFRGDAKKKEKEKEKGVKSKVKSEKSVKDLAGALARFWVG